MVEFILGEKRMLGNTKVCAPRPTIRAFNRVCTPLSFFVQLFTEQLFFVRRMIGKTKTCPLEPIIRSFNKVYTLLSFFILIFIMCFMAENECSVRPKCAPQDRLFGVSTECAPHCPFHPFFIKKIF